MAASTRMPADVGKAAWLFLAPALVLIFVFFCLPVLASLVLSVTDFDIYAIANPSTTRFVGLANYQKLLHSPEFWQALKNTFYFALVGGPITIAVSLGTALLLNAKLVRFKSFFRTIYFTPFVTTLVAVAIVWRYLYHTRYGLLNYTLGHFGPKTKWPRCSRRAAPRLTVSSTPKTTLRSAACNAPRRWWGGA